MKSLPEQLFPAGAVFPTKSDAVALLPGNGVNTPPPLATPDLLVTELSASVEKSSDRVPNASIPPPPLSFAVVDEVEMELLASLVHAAIRLGPKGCRSARRCVKVRLVRPRIAERAWPIKGLPVRPA